MRLATACALLFVTRWVCTEAADAAPAQTQPDYTLYNTREQLFQKVFDVVDKHPHFMEIDEVPLSVDEYTATMTVVTVEPGGMSGHHEGKIRILISFGEHGRELVTPEVGLRLLEMLGQLGQDLEQEDATSAATKHQLLRQTVFKILPMENVNGRKLVESGNLCERKNGRGVDPNRNWDAHWGFKEADYDPAEEYPGAAAFRLPLPIVVQCSEPETAMLLALTNAFRQHVWLNMHSGMEALFMPYDHLATIPEGPGPGATLKILEQLNTLHCGGRCAVGSGGKSVGYLAHGTATDYMYDVAKVPMSFTWEIFGDFEAEYVDCYKMFNPIDRKTLEATVSNWAAAILTLVSLLPNHPDIAALNLNETVALQATATSGTKAQAVITAHDESVRKGVAKEQMAVSTDEISSHDGGVHGGRNDDMLQSVVELHDSVSDHHDIDGSVHENVLGTAATKQATDVPGTIGWVHVLPFAVLLLLGVIIKRSRTDRTSCFRLRHRSASLPIRSEHRV